MEVNFLRKWKLIFACCYFFFIISKISFKSSSDTSSVCAKNENIDFNDPPKNVFFTSFIKERVYSSFLMAALKSCDLPIFSYVTNPLSFNILRNVSSVLRAGLGSGNLLMISEE